MALMEMFNSKPMETKPLNGIIWNSRAAVALFYLSPVKFWSIVKHMERARRIQLPPSVWKTEVLALNYARIFIKHFKLEIRRLFKITVCFVYTHINLLVESSFNILVGVAGLEPARPEVNGFSYYSMSP